MDAFRWYEIFDDEQRTVRLHTDTQRLAPLRAFFWEARDESHPTIIEAALRGVGIGLEQAGVIFFGDLDGPERGRLLAGEVEVYDPLDSVVLQEEIFLHVLLTGGRLALRVRRKRGTASATWERRMSGLLGKLEHRLR